MTHNGRDGAIDTSSEERQPLKSCDREVLNLDDLTEEDLRALQRARPAPGSAKFNREVRNHSPAPGGD